VVCHRNCRSLACTGLQQLGQQLDAAILHSSCRKCAVGRDIVEEQEVMACDEDAGHGDIYCEDPDYRLRGVLPCMLTLCREWHCPVCNRCYDCDDKLHALQSVDDGNVYKQWHTHVLQCLRAKRARTQ
jgi:hypothetical protein